MLNRHFTSVGLNLGATLPDTDLDSLNLEMHPPIFELHEISEQDISEAIGMLSSSQAFNDDGITSFMLKCARTELLKLLYYIFNLSLNTACFPALWKNARVTPLFKGGSGELLGNYRPISVLSTVSKILKRCVHIQCYKYLTDNRLLSSAQSGFRKRHSTDTCLAGFLDDIYREVDNGGACGVLFLDLAKAFDTVDFDVLIEKLRALGFKSNTRKWFCSYLSDRSQVTVVKGSESSPGQLSSGVPQGSILGPLLFICYINDLPLALRHSDPYIYADDTALIVKGDDPISIAHNLNQDAENLDDWFKRNRLSCTINKTKCMLFCNNHYSRRHIPLAVNMNGEPVEEVSNFKYLGLNLDRHLNFEHHAEKVVNKVKSCTATLWRCRSFITLDLAKDLYSSLIEPHFTYACCHYDGCSAKASSMLQTARNKALRAVLGVDSRYSATSLYERLNVTQLSNSRKYHTVCMAYHGIHDLSSPNVNNMFQVHDPPRCLRSSSSISIKAERCKTVIGSKSLFHRGHRYWSIMPTETKNSGSLPCFKRLAKSFFCV